MRGMFRAAMSLNTAASASTLLCTSETSANLGSIQLRCLASIVFNAARA